jgi:hypothetical protein
MRFFCRHKYELRIDELEELDQYDREQAEVYRFCKKCGKFEHLGKGRVPTTESFRILRSQYRELWNRMGIFKELENVILEKGIHSQINTMYSAVSEAAARLDPADESDYALRVRQAAGILK